MKYPLIISDELRDFLRHLPPDIKKKIKEAFGEISSDPNAGKLLREELEGLRSYKIGRVRVVYRLETAAISLIAIGPRKTIYQKILLEMKHQLGN